MKYNHYNVYPSMMDGYTYLLNRLGDLSEEEANQAEKDFLNSVNRVPIIPNMLVDRGTALNEVLDRIIERREIHQDVNGCYAVGTGNFVFNFNGELVKSLLDEIGGAVCQPRLSADFRIGGSVVTLYGNADYMREHTIIDLKCKKSYEFPSYLNAWQKDVYPLIAERMGLYVEEFRYLVAVCGEPRQFPDVTGGNIYHEDYTFDQRASLARVENFLGEYLLPWLDSQDENIVLRKIFGEWK